MTTFAERLKNAMEQANMSQSALSEQAGASKAAISQYPVSYTHLDVYKRQILGGPC